MKKLLSILVAILALCLVFSIAMADNDGDNDSEFDGYPYEEAIRIHQIDGDNVKNPVVIRESTCSERGILRFTCEENATHVHEVYLKKTEHDWKLKSAADCTKPAVYECTVCHETKTDKALGHIWSSEYKNWSAEDKTKYSPKDYNLSSDGDYKWMAGQVEKGFDWGRITVQPTCTTEGQAIDFCPRCGAENADVNPRIIKPVDHYPIYVVDYFPTCRSTGKAHYECYYCGKIFSEVTLAIDPDAHDWDEWVLDKEPTCFEDGSEIRWCKICGDKQVMPVDKLDPEWERRDSRLVDCYTQQTTFYCVNCDSKATGHEEWYVTKPVESHLFKQETKYLVKEIKAGYLVDGETTVIDLSKVDVLDLITMNSSNVKDCNQAGARVYKCVYFDDNALHNGDPDAYLVVYVDAPGHKWNKWEQRYTVDHDGSGNEYGYWLRDCSVCGKHEERISEYAPEDACEEHVYEYQYTVEPVCSIDDEDMVDGYDLYQCTVCGHKDKQNVVKAAHTFESITVPATYEEYGKLIKVCTVCGKVVEDEITPVDPSKVEAFVRRLYGVVLGRIGGVAEVRQYADALVSGDKNAAEVVSDFINSPEFAKQEDADTIEALYNTMLDRESDVAGYVDWNNLAAYGVSNNKLINGFAGSQEFEELCKEYDIKPGKLEEETRDRNVSVTGFVNRCYREALNRDGEADGLNYWTGKLLTAELTPQEVGFGFVFSDEFDAEDRIAGGEAADVVWSLYGLYLDRAPSAGEVDWYVAQLESGDMTLEQLNYSFAESDEFKNIILTYNMYAVAE